MRHGLAAHSFDCDLIMSRNQDQAVGIITGFLSALMGEGPLQMGMCCFNVKMSFRTKEGRLIHDE